MRARNMPDVGVANSKASSLKRLQKPYTRGIHATVEDTEGAAGAGNDFDTQKPSWQNGRVPRMAASR